MPARSVQAVVTSPPYYGLRDYGHAGQLGAEARPSLYVERLVAIFEEVRRVLRDDGVVWLNLGDSYGRRGGGGPDLGGEAKHKDLLGVPWRVAFALQDAGWYLRKEVVWEKPNPTPERVRDWLTSAHESIFLLAKSERYFYDVEAYKEPSVAERPAGNGYAREQRIAGPGARGLHRGDDDHRWQLGDTRQLRDVWRIPTVPFPGAHFAVFPPELPRRCILLGTSPRACDRCRAPFVRIVKRTRTLDGEPVGGSWGGERGQSHRIAPQGVGHWRFATETQTLGWRPSCACDAPPGVEAGDLDVIESPLGEREQALALRLERGRGWGLALSGRERAGVREMTRYEQRQLARQLAGSDHREAMEAEAGSETFAHYLRTDAAGARAPRADLLDGWVERGWVHRVDTPPPWWPADAQERCVVLDPFTGAGTTGLVAVEEGRDFAGVELNPEYAQMARERIRSVAAAPRFDLDDERAAAAR